MGLSYVFPAITDATISPNPVSINTAFKISVRVVEQTVVLTEELIHSNETYSGEMT